ncbi:MAG: SDR family NAD(P)-dependent oxidoreductase [Lactobacillaceae bacterium]|jgi:NAD(P)-dependent dehydrogenase (short-subunit alcohol dehydrogenase family)|nr:SDR family NAD(P)-dependent oxidoreductase [Lactobacillaceae bacterium]
MKTIVITGGSDGIGSAAAKQLIELGHRVVITGRNPEKTKKVADQLHIPYYVADFSKLSDVVKLAHELLKYPQIDVLANNAGGIMGKRTLTEDGFERTFQVNYLAEFLLTKLLMPKLIESKATVIQTSSIAANMFGSKFDVNDLNVTKDYSSEKAYGYAKLENILFTRELNKRFAGKINPVAFHPGVVRTSFSSESNSVMKIIYRTPLKYLFTISSETSAKRLVNLALGEPGKDFQDGQVYDGRKLLPVKFQDPDSTVAEKLWNQSETMASRFF